MLGWIGYSFGNFQWCCTGVNLFRLSDPRVAPVMVCDCGAWAHTNVKLLHFLLLVANYLLVNELDALKCPNSVYSQSSRKVPL